MAASTVFPGAELNSTFTALRKLLLAVTDSQFAGQLDIVREQKNQSLLILNESSMPEGLLALGQT
ncbi:hypothetical protein HCU74_09895 [Spongiibacter sp. KMU-166]|uniref:Uncharacterized protein n=1 Tax=Spongiibacter thalassae TaxID=2721624 RepID=A0ABX1GH19_9GAMM|nr:hypothetical protein [Spongiibacter thalassae]NKI17733.1 hypothetical protein [Spongiibacter thalassae]